jgi:putative spermidine/putrescine transport system permease protein
MTIAPSLWFKATRASAFLLLAYAVVPALIVIPVSFTDTSWLALPRDHLSLEHWRTLFFAPQWRDSLLQSVFVTAISTTCAVALGTLAAIGLRQLTPRSAGLVRLMLIFPLVVPSVIAGLGWYRAFIPLGLLDTYPGVILAHTVTSLPLVLVTVTASLASFDDKLEQAARSMGAGTWTTLLWVTLPSIKPGILSGAIFAFIHSWDEVVILLFITTRDVYLLPRAIWDGINENVDPTIAAASTLMILVTTTALFLSQTGARRRGKA